MRATAATNNAREYKADIGRVQQWLGHADISTARLYGVAPRTGRRLAPVVTSDWGQGSPHFVSLTGVLVALILL